MSAEPEKKSLVTVFELGDVPKAMASVVNNFLDKISGCAGALYEPTHVKRMAKAKAAATIIETTSEIEASKLRRVAKRLLAEESRNQDNRDSIARQSVPLLLPTAKSEKMNDDWVAHFFEKCQTVSDGDAQALFAKVLAGEANAPGSFSKRTIAFLAELEKPEAVAFKTLCGFCWKFDEFVPIILAADREKIYGSHGLTWKVLIHLESIGLIQVFQGMHTSESLAVKIPNDLTVHYFGQSLRFSGQKFKQHVFRNGPNVGTVRFRQLGFEVQKICAARPVPGFFELMKDKWATFLPGGRALPE